MSNYKLTKRDIAEFESMWDENHWEGDTEHDSNEFRWAQTFFELGINHARNILLPKELESYENTVQGLTGHLNERRTIISEHENTITWLTRQAALLQEKIEGKEDTIAGLTRQAVLLQEKIDALEAEQAVYDEIDDLSLKVANYKDVINLLVEMI